MKKIIILVSALALLGLTSGCSDDTDSGSSSGGGDGAVNSGVDSGIKISEVTDSQAEQVCISMMEASNSLEASITDYTCAISGYTEASKTYAIDPTADDTTLQSDCQDAVTSCAAESADPIDPQAECAGATANDVPANCNATVGEFETCMSDYLNSAADAMNDAMKQIPDCDSLTGADLESFDMGAGTDEPTLPDSCASLEKKCPGMMDLVAMVK